MKFVFPSRSVAGVLVSSLALAISFVSVSGSPGAADDDPGGYYVPVTPTRLLDTVTSGVPFTPNGSQTVQVTGPDTPVPGTGVVAVVLDVEVTSATADSAMMAYKPGAGWDYAFLRYGPGAVPASNTVIVEPDSSGEVSLHNVAGMTDANVDIAGYFSSASSSSSAGYHSITPDRIAAITQGSGQNTYSIQASGVGISR